MAGAPLKIETNTRSQSVRLFSILVGVVILYYWLGIAGATVGLLLIFMLYELLIPPPRYRKFGLGQIQEAVDNKFGKFGKTYPEETPSTERRPPQARRNDPCPCGSGLKFKRCCGRVQE